MSTKELTEIEELISDIRFVLYKLKENKASKLETIYHIEETLNFYAISNKINKL